MNFNTNIVILVTAQVSSFYYQILNIVMQNTESHLHFCEMDNGLYINRIYHGWIDLLVLPKQLD